MFRVNNNKTSLVALRYLDRTGRQITQTTERLASGLRINRARDDAAGMFISENLRAQIAAMKQANRNVAQATAMLQVMEGGLDRMTGLLTRLKELAIQAADGAYSDLQRQRGIQVEADELIAELNRITTGITFNGITLFPDIESSITFQVGETTQDRVNLGLNAVNAYQLLGGFASKVGFIKETETLVDNDGTTTTTADLTANADGTGTLTATTANAEFLQDLQVGDLVRVDGYEFFVKSVDSESQATLDLTLEGQVKVVSGSQTVVGIGTKFTKQLKNNDIFLLNGNRYKVTATPTSDTQVSVQLVDAGGTPIDGGEGVGVPADTFTGRATLTSFDSAPTGATIDKATVAGAYTMMGEGTIAEGFLNQIGDGIDTVVSQRARLGAIQSRLERTAETNMINIENTTNADSVIRDADMAQEISALVRAQILAQAGSAVLNQANLLPQTVLSLLQALS